MHLGGNMLYLWIFPIMSRTVSGVAGSLFSIFCGVCAAFAQALTDPSSPVPMVGASGAIAGVLELICCCIRAPIFAALSAF